MSPDGIIKEYFDCLNRHDKATIKQIIYPNKPLESFYWHVDNVQVTSLNELYKNADRITYKICFNVTFNKNYSSSLPDGSYNWTFTLANNNNRWFLFDCGY